MIEGAFVPASSGHIAAEVEWLVHDLADETRPVVADEVLAAVGEAVLPSGGRLSVEPGGQLELSTPTFADPARLNDAIDRDEAELRRRCRRAGLRLRNAGYDDARPPLRSVRSERYDAMEAWFRRQCPEGIEMMCSTASLQINVDFGEDPAASYRRAVCVAARLGDAFRNAPRRQAVWRAIDRARGGPPPSTADEWPDYVLDTAVFGSGGCGDGGGGRTLRQWPEATPADVSRHVSTLFPPVRPRGYLEIRTLDAQPAEARRAAITAAWSLLLGRDPASPRSIGEQP